MEKIKAGLVSLRDLLATAWWVILIVGIGFVVAFNYVKPAPPDHIIISTGAEGGAYYHFAGRYSAILARNGIALEVRPSAGSAENLQRLEKGEADVAFIQGGGGPANENTYSFEETPAKSLGGMFYEPVWVFYRGDKKLDRLTQFAGKRIAIGQEGSGVRQLASQLLEANGIASKGDHVIPLAGQEAAEALKKGKLDAIFVVAAVEAPIVQTLLNAPGVKLLSFTQADAYLRRFPFLSKVVLPQGVVDFARETPPEDVVLLAAIANLAVRSDLHPALQALLMQATSEIHGKAGFFQKAGEFPAYRDQTLPLAAEADRFFKSGPPFLQRYLPFWLAVLVERLFVLAVPVLALLIPLLRIAPSLYSWRIRSRIFRLYGELKFLEHDLKDQFESSKSGDYLSRLDTIEEEANGLAIPLAYTDLIYTLREHINLVRKILIRQRAQAPGAEAAKTEA